MWDLESWITLQSRQSQNWQSNPGIGYYMKHTHGFQYNYVFFGSFPGFKTLYCK